MSAASRAGGRDPLEQGTLAHDFAKHWLPMTQEADQGDRGHTPANFSRTERLQIPLPADELEAIDDFRFRNRIPTRAAAVRELIRRGLASADED
jgi:hypothetical protein